MRVKTEDLQGEALDYAVAVSVGQDVSATVYYAGINQYGRVESSRAIEISNYSPSTDWSQGGPIVDKLIAEGFEISPGNMGTSVICRDHSDDLVPYPPRGWDADMVAECGSTVLIAACRAIVAENLGDKVDVPEELSEQ